MAKWEGSRLTVWDSTQGVFPIQSGLMQALKLPASSVRVIGHYMGGGFGSKLSVSKHTVIAALLARITARPVKLHLTREESFLAVGNRPPSSTTIKAGVKKDGTITALQMTVLGTGGAYPGGGVGGVDWVVRDLYTCANVKTELSDVFINAGQARAFRAPGHPQGAWALELMMDQLAEKIGMDPVEFRTKNAPSISQGTTGTPPYSTTGLTACLAEGAKRFGWRDARNKPAGDGAIRRGVGVAAGLWRGGNGGPPATIIVKLFADGSANLNMGASDLGTGSKTVMAMVVAEELGDSARQDPGGMGRHRDDAVRHRERRQQDRADRSAGDAGGGARRQAAAAGHGGDAAEGHGGRARAQGRRDHLDHGPDEEGGADGRGRAPQPRPDCRRRVSRAEPGRHGRPARSPRTSRRSRSTRAPAK